MRKNNPPDLLIRGRLCVTVSQNPDIYFYALTNKYTVYRIFFVTFLYWRDYAWIDEPVFYALRLWLINQEV